MEGAYTRHQHDKISFGDMCPSPAVGPITTKNGSRGVSPREDTGINAAENHYLNTSNRPKRWLLNGACL